MLQRTPMLVSLCAVVRKALPHAVLDVLVCRQGPTATEDWAAAQGAHPATGMNAWKWCNAPGAQ